MIQIDDHIFQMGWGKTTNLDHFTRREVQQRVETPEKLAETPQKEAGSSSNPLVFQERTFAVKLWGGIASWLAMENPHS